MVSADQKLSVSYTQTDDGLYRMMKMKFNDYFNFSMVAAEGKRAENLGTCEQECKLDPARELCCAKIEMYNKDGKKQFMTLECMDVKVLDISTGLWIDDFYYEYECDGYQNRRRQERAAGLTITITSLFMAAAVYLS